MADDITVRILMQSLDAVESMREHVDGFRSEVADLRSENVLNKTYRLDLKEFEKELKEEAHARRKDIRELEEKVIELNQVIAKKKDTEALALRLDVIEKTHARWYGALGVFGLLLGYFSSAIKTWIASLLS